MSSTSVTGILLAGGKSSRMGTEKGLVELSGRKLIDIGIGLLSNLCDRILISSNSEFYRYTGLEIIPDIKPGIGPMGGLYSALMSSTSRANLVISVDQPFLTPGFLDFLLEQLVGFQAAVPCWGEEHYEPLSAGYDISVLSSIESFIQKGNFKLPDLFKEISINRLNVNIKQEFYHPNMFFNINSPHDLISAEKLMNSIL